MFLQTFAVVASIVNVSFGAPTLTCTVSNGDGNGTVCTSNCPAVERIRQEFSNLKMAGAVSDLFAREVEHLLEMRRCERESGGRDRFWCEEDGQWSADDEDEEEDINKMPLNRVCGRVRLSSSLRVADHSGDSEDPAGTWPWMVSYGYWNTGEDGNHTWMHKCGGTLITHRHVLTAAHCSDGNKYSVRLGDSDLSSSYDDQDAVDIAVDEFIPHPLRHGLEDTLYYDVAVLRLARSVSFNDYVLPVCLPAVAAQNPNHNAGKLVTLTGWGKRRMNGDSAGGYLKRTHIGIFSQRYCNLTHTLHGESDFVRKLRRAVPDLFRDHVVCAGYENDGIGSCVGDSGGPLVHFTTDRGFGPPKYVQLGVVSGGVGACGDRDLPGVYSRLDHPEILDFVKKVASGAETVSFWSSWGAWSSCSEPCDEGIRTRTRGCLDTSGDAENVTCPDWGDRKQEEPCVVQECRITNVRAKTARGDNAGVDKFGAVSALFCAGPDQGARGNCCHTGRLDNPSKDDFEEGATDDFWGFMIGDCQDFHIPYAEIGSASAVHLMIDGWKGEYFEVTFANGAARVRCGERNGKSHFKIDDDDMLPLKCEKIK